MSLWIVWLSISATAATQITESFTLRSHFVSGTAVWNQYLGKVHPSLEVVGYQSGQPAVAVDVGDGSHGVFDSTTYASFSTNGDVSGNVIHLDTTRYTTLKVTNFVLDAGWTLKPEGGNPLKIYSLNDVLIRGDIWCHGGNGGNGVNATAGAGGSGRCGGGDGGSGGAVTGNGGNGGDASAGNVTGGRGGNYTGGAAVGGGGGGSWNTTSSAANGANATASGGQGGQSKKEPEFSTIAGGAGGGGGSGTGASAGAGGGAGGGTVIIHAVRNFDLGTSPSSTTGFIYGGVGGTSNAAGGSGGGGGGGSVQVFAGGTINIYNTNGSGASQAQQGSTPVSGGPGRSWFSSAVYNGVGFYTPSEQLPLSAGSVQYSASSQEVITTSWDTVSSLIDVQSVSTNPASADFKIYLNGSSDISFADQTGWTTDLGLLKHKRYLQIKAVITTSSVSNPTMLDDVTITYDSGTQNDFNFNTAGCGSLKSQPPKGPGLPVCLMLLPMIVLLLSRRKAKNQE